MIPGIKKIIREAIKHPIGQTAKLIGALLLAASGGKITGIAFNEWLDSDDNNIDQLTPSLQFRNILLIISIIFNFSAAQIKHLEMVNGMFPTVLRIVGADITVQADQWDEEFVFAALERMLQRQNMMQFCYYVKKRGQEARMLHLRETKSLDLMFYDALANEKKLELLYCYFATTFSVKKQMLNKNGRFVLL